jgi:crotonobetainyl-CoA:carnitine CoA-transferase CaiB-like acyl-CoA transferase
MAARLMRLVDGGAAPGDDAPLVGSAGPDARRARIDAWCAAHTMEEICAALTEIGVPAGPVRTIPEVARDPHLWDRQMLVKMDDAVAGEMYLPGATIKMSKTPGRIGPVPTPGQHTDEIIGNVLGYDSSTIGNLRSAGAIA